MALRWLISGTVVLLFATTTAWGQTVQLPTYQFTTASTTVLVPDRGSTSLGGFGNSSSGSNALGIPGGVGPLFHSRSWGRSTGASSGRVHVTLIDHLSWDDAVRASAPRDPAFSVDQRRADWLSANVARYDPPPTFLSSSAPESLVASLEDIRRRNEVLAAERLTEADDYFRQGMRAEAEGKVGAARVYYQMAQRRAKGPRLEEIERRLAAL